MDHINLGFPQKTFDFDQSHSDDLKKVHDIITTWIAGHDHAMLDQVAAHLSAQPDKWSTAYIFDLLNILFKDDKIHFVIDGKKIFSENVKTAFSTGVTSKSRFLELRDSFSVIRTCLSDPAQWKRVEIIKPEKAPESDMLRAGHLGEKLFGSVGETSQNSLCRELRKCLRSWENDLG
ncbi:MAG: hypothetical protein Q8P24_21865, partial [Desulfobacterales bacterium]|nr:hypothetical protein [Desulfobacterales bacterium]